MQFWNRSSSAARKNLAVSLLVLACAFVAPQTAHAQGCIVARSPEQVLPGIDQADTPTLDKDGKPLNQGGYLLPGHVQFTVAERHQYSYQHFVGDVYQEHRAQERSAIQNKVNIVTADLVYQWKPRISFEINAPWLFATRKQQSSPIVYYSSGLGDTILAANFWIFNPTTAVHGNFSVGGGIYMPTGNDDYQNTVNTNTTGTGPAVEVTTPVDYSIQPGNGGWGALLQWQGFHTLGKKLVVYTDGDYIATQGGTNGVARGTFTNPATPLDNNVAIADQYLMEGGVAAPIAHVRGLAGTFAIRDEGVPASNLFPVSNEGWRRPGYAVSAGPGAEYMRGSHILTAAVYRAERRDRTVSYGDKLYGGHGDAAFAKYLWLTSYTYRF